MSRFQAMTTDLLDRELEAIRQEMGLREGQKAELLRELAAMASWLLAQARAGRTIEARGPDGTEVFHHPALAARVSRVVLAAGEADALSRLLAEDREPGPALRETLRRLADPARTPPAVEWPEE